MPKKRWQFVFEVTDVDLSDPQLRDRVARAVTLAGAAALGDALPGDFATERVGGAEDPFLVRHICGLPPFIEIDPRAPTATTDL